MSDHQGDRPEENVPAQTPETSTPHPTPAAEAAAPAAPTGAGTPDSAGATRPAPPLPPAGWQAQRPPYTGTPQPAYGVPPRPEYAGQPAQPGAAFGATATHPTVPLADSAPAPARRSGGAGKVAALIVAAALVGGGAGLGGAYAGVQLWGGTTSSPAAGPQTVTVNNPDSVTATSAIAAKVVPSVVTISASSGSGGGTGSGVVLNDEGYVLTNTHVVTLDGQTGDAQLSVTTSDGRVFEATIVGTDPTYDLAVIKLEGATNLTPIEWGDSDKLNVGDATVAVGAPLGLSNTVTTGIVSALNRSIQVASSAAPEGNGDQQAPEQGGESPFFFDFGQGQQQQQATESISIAVIQTDAAINPGNSGGALVNSEGKLIGINVAIASAGGSSSGGQSGSIGVGFSIPSDIAQRVSQEIIENGSATHGLLGASVQPASSVQGTDIAGAYLADVSQGGAAQQAGLRKGDIVTEFNGKPITDATDLTAQVRALAAGSEAKITYVRGGSSETATVTLGELGS
ncbi:trypsin-like peptidase domain-containing protein [Microbacterium sp. 10M-3C3]|uniref:S1C family serine protease n=1 Tax=Microbacterium sp. 10M-3C3 TaxID=2483401 RepID=UPI000F63ED77|nr:trypsin-like peptidase domain-containing protein [Microbacterium sp. 10M-3C3]